MNVNELHDDAISELVEGALQPGLEQASSVATSRADGTQVPELDGIELLRNTQDATRRLQARTVLVAAQLLSSGTRQTTLAAALGFSSASNFAKDALWQQLKRLADALTEARRNGQRELPVVEVQVPVRRQEFRTYRFVNVSTRLTTLAE
ncbi:hypothetical protein FM104_14385 [Microbacterium esteraromaticum]|uniref:Uncharacterized protein n=2 Tax=Microbacterium esteraromaticum TaxID=57043 RepID=A0A1R4KNG5_9MICO|nr:hypothetical protein FM104_14385 [Microbacterium esteraromaticum]